MTIERRPPSEHLAVRADGISPERQANPTARRSLHDVIGPPDEETSRRLVAVRAYACAASRSEGGQQKTGEAA